ncbi:DEAD/DEAH box helicase [uncultured Clostridium sp.]|uniref:helicase-related protein n=1 Tax=uncultured Clostridium sp. TaxID=59620 RepID=UPI0025EAF3E3|nr:DEAD/DEAH box helicase [uncultured Clostridium sp.]
MASTKFTLSREVRNEIAHYIDSEFINELLQEIVRYIKTTGKVTIDDSSFNERDENSKVSLIDSGSFNIYDYMYTKDFLEEISWEGSYIEEETEDDKSHDYIKVFRYEPKDISHVIYDKVQSSMEQKKAFLYKEFKKKYDEDFLFSSVRFYKRTRDGKEYYDINLQEMNPDKKRSLAERIKTELGNAFKSRWGSSIISKVSSVDDQLMLESYEKGCTLLGIPNDYFTECVDESASPSENELIDIMESSCRDVDSQLEGILKLKMKVINTIDKRIDTFLNMKIYKTAQHMEKFLEDSRKLVFGYYKSLSIGRDRHHLRQKEERIEKIIKRMAIVENILYNDYQNENEKAPSITEMKEFYECIPWICFKGTVWTAENIYIKKVAKDELKDIILDDPINEFEEARYLERHFYLHVGETNTGKTFSSIQRLMEAETGAYLAPLRLLALEIQDKLNSENVPCSLLTGEEEDIIPYAGHVSSTIEKLQTGVRYDVIVIDEAQMINDSQRGWAWTRAIIAALAPEIHVCMAPEALAIVKKLIEECGDTYEIIEHKRDTELIFEDKAFDLDKDIKPGDALVVFGKRKALAVSAELLNKNIKTSIIYGSLPYSTRKKQFDRFLNGETDVIVCTDAIGMGVNLPIKRIVFLETRKYDGVSLRRLKVSEIKQIAGRAGRKGIYNEGYVAAACDINLIRGALKTVPQPIEKCYTGIPESLLGIDIDIIDALKTWSSMNLKGFYAKTDVTRIIYLLNRIKKMGLDVSKEDALKMATIPFEENNKAVFALWEEYCRMYSKGAINLKKPVLNKNVSSKKELDDLESYYKCLDLNYSFGKNFNIMINNRYICSEKETAANKINDLLLTKLLDHERTCSVCGRKLSWDYPNDVCRKCRDVMMEIKREKAKVPPFRRIGAKGHSRRRKRRR